ncbi:MAG: DUF4258 domain-containing protein [Roseofilum sp. SBFL]|jgi:hypothetical protein|uniref:DUF4258 domain-containing protein n=1 Tax=unclassified Roseofilum TaxID=2620099 RepID=UPI001B266C29|nr:MULTISPECIES: DUF4258 domain-containing protein [unclassified Roseofilum]MBP0040293.1 DUF4258 domain-containing protein [Roseofilum sp. SID1]MBP0042882.1 DUF4258 domain-containing protein [Roseofilum sp. SBFL]
MNFQFSNHALEEIQKRNIPMVLIEAVLWSPQQTLKQSEDITIYQSQLDFGTGKLYLLRVFINITVDPQLVVTVYRTSKIQKYWRNP